MSMPFIKSSHTKRRQAITDIIESIALEECAISHILNAEGEKLQRVVTFESLCVDDIVTVNESLCDLIKNICGLENAFKEKLQLFENCICPDCHDRNCNDILIDEE
jgi:hypothetical protein